MAKKQIYLDSLKEPCEFLPVDERLAIQQEEDELFKKEERYLRGQLTNARRKHDSKYELIILTKLGELYRENSYYDKAIEYYEEALNIDKEYFYAIDGLGVTYYRIGEYDKAIGYFQQELNPIVAMTNLSRVYRAKGDYNRAIKYAERVLEKDSEDVNAMNELGINYRLKQDYLQSIRWFERGLKIEPHDEQVMDELGITYREMGRYDQAIEWFEKKLKLYPNDKEALDGLGITYRKMECYEEAIEQFKKYFKLYPDDEYALYNLERTYEEMGETPQVVEYLKRQLRSSPEDSIVRSQLRTIGEKYEATGKLREAKEILDFLRETPQTKSLSFTLDAVISDEIETESLKEKIEQLERKIQQQEELLHSRQMATLGVMASGLSHEINQPLQIILAIAQNCTRDIQRNTIYTEGILTDLEHIATTTKRIDKIVNHLHVLAREHEPKLEAVDVNMVIENSFIMFHQQLKSRGIKIEQNFLLDLPPVKADMIQLEQVFINLINNAHDALEGCANKTITISTQEQNGHIEIRFQDNGGGIALENLPKIFDAFFTTKQEKGGIGLGLYIAQDIIQSFGGTITVDSRVNEGTTFLIKLPIAGKEDSE